MIVVTNEYTHNHICPKCGDEYPCPNPNESKTHQCDKVCILCVLVSEFDDFEEINND